MTNYTHFATELIFVVGVVGGDGWLEGHSFDTVTLYELYVYAEDPHIFFFFFFFFCLDGIKLDGRKYRVYRMIEYIVFCIVNERRINTKLGK